MNLASTLAHRSPSVREQLLAQHEKEIAAFCRQHHIARMALFGSALREDFGPESDLDILVEFVPGHTPGFAFIAMQDTLSELFGRCVDLHTPQSLSRYFREQVVSEAENLYVSP